MDTDICIIGAGAAGITIARALLGAKTSVCLLEGGAVDGDGASQSLYLSARNVGRPYPILPGSRLRYFGGSTNHWGGHCVPMRAINFERAPWSDYSGWPISLEDLDPYYPRAEEILGLNGASTDSQTVAGDLGQELFPFDSDRVQTQVSRYNPVRFGRVFRHELELSRNVKVVLGANVTSIEARESGERIDHVVVRTMDGRRLIVRAGAFVLATGGIENPRLLLVSNSVHRNGLGNQHDLVGRFFTEHIWYPSGVILPSRLEPVRTLYTKEVPAGAIAYRAHLILPEKVVREAGIPDFRAELAEIRFASNSSAIVRSPRPISDVVEDLEQFDYLAPHVANIIRDRQEAISAARGVGHGYLLLNNVEQTPNPYSRVTLIEKRDVLGMPIAAIDWQLSKIDKQGIRVAHDCIARELGRSGYGRLFDDMPEGEAQLLNGANGGAHHMGTTRMSDDPHRGVVDRNCKVHGLDNLFVAGSSVFPTSGFANPTFTILTLALRLADHLRADFSQRG